MRRGALEQRARVREYLASVIPPGMTRERNFDILPDGQRFIGRQIAEDEKSRAGGPQRVEVVTNLSELIARRR